MALAVAFGAGALGGTTTVETIRDVSAPATSVSNTFPPSRGSRLTIGQIYKDVAPGVVQITATTEVVTPADPFFDPLGPTVQKEKALGSGFVIDKAGHVVTNYHVIAGAKSIQVSFSNNESFKAQVVGKDPTTDLAVLRVNASSRALTPLAMGDSDRVQVGDQVIAIGNPFGLTRSVTAGIVSALQRQIASPNQYTIDHVIQTDAAINHGNSGGPLISTGGQVIGVNAQIDTASTSEQNNAGIGLAIPSNTVKTVVGQLLKTGRVEHPFLGVEPQTITPVPARILHLPAVSGMLVEKVDPGSGAAKAGLRGGTRQVTVAGESYMLGGDIIVKVDGARVASLARLRDLVAAKQPGETMTLTIYRSSVGPSGWKLLDVDVKLGRQPSSG